MPEQRDIDRMKRNLRRWGLGSLVDSADRPHQSQPKDASSAEAAENVQCEITGRWVKPDEAIEFMGYTVSAEGKAALLERLKSGEVVSGHLGSRTRLPDVYETIRKGQQRVYRSGITLCRVAVLSMALIPVSRSSFVVGVLLDVELLTVGPIATALIVIGVWGPINRRTICDLAQLLSASERQSIERANHARRTLVLVAGVLALGLSIGGFVFFIASPVPKHLALGLVGFISAGPVGFVLLLIGLFR